MKQFNFHTLAQSLLILMLALSLFACGTGPRSSSSDEGEAPSVEQTDNTVQPSQPPVEEIPAPSNQTEATTPPDKVEAVKATEEKEEASATPRKSAISKSKSIKAPTEEPSDEMPDETASATVEPASPEAPAAFNPEEYKITLSVKDSMTVGVPTPLTVWIGHADSKEAPKASQGDAHAEAAIIKEEETLYAKVIPELPTGYFDINQEESEIVLLRRSGSGFNFKITPKKRGNELKIKATVKLYADLQGTIPAGSKLSGDLIVSVTVDESGKWFDLKNDVIDSSIPYIREFLIALVVLLLGATLFVVRRYVKKKTGYSGDVTALKDLVDKAESLKHPTTAKTPDTDDKTADTTTAPTDTEKTPEG